MCSISITSVIPDQESSFWQKRFDKADPQTGRKLESRRLKEEMTFAMMQRKFKPAIVTEADVVGLIRGGSLPRGKRIDFFFLDGGVVANVFPDDENDEDWSVVMDSVDRPDIWVEDHHVFSTAFGKEN